MYNQVAKMTNKDMNYKNGATKNNSSEWKKN